METNLFLYFRPRYHLNHAHLFMNFFLNLLKVFFLGLLLIFLFLGGSYLYLNKALPTGEKGAAADQLANQMLEALNYPAYKELDYIEWTFSRLGRERHYKWQKNKGLCTVSWDSISVKLATSRVNESIVKVNGVLYAGSKKNEFIRTAESKFNNDTFWLVAPYKVFDAGVERRLVRVNDAENALLVTYTSGGSTPGDSYLWYFDEMHRPKAFEMWVGLLPVGGLRATWDQWQTSTNGAYFPESHKILILNLSIDDLKSRF